MSNPVPTMYLVKPILYISGIHQSVTDEEIISALYECLRARLRINREGSKWDQTTGTVEFEKLENAEKAYATLHNFKFHDHNCTLKLSHSPSPTSDPTPSAKTRLIKFLPGESTPGKLFNLFRPFGPIYRIVLNHITNSEGFECFSGTALIDYYEENQASLAQMEMHCADIEGQTIAVEEYDDRRDRAGRTKAVLNGTTAESKWAQASTFVPATSHPMPELKDKRLSFQSTLSDHNTSVSKWASAQTYQQPYLQNPNSIPASPALDVSLSPRSNWTMSPQTPQPVSHLNPEALARLGQKQIDPCNLFIKGLGPDVDSGDLFHAFKQFGTIVSARVMKNEATGLSKQFGFVSFNTEEATSNALHAMDGAMIGNTTNRIVVRLHELKKYKEGRTKIVGVSPLGSQLEHGNDGSHPSIAKLTAESPILSRSGSMDARIDVQMAEAIQSIHLNANQNTNGDVQHSTTSSISSPQGPAPSAQLRPSGPSASGCASPTTSVVSLTPLSERERMLTAVLKLNDHTIGQKLEDLIDLLMALPTKERKICLFNPHVLATKVCEAKEIIETPDEVVDIIQNHEPVKFAHTTPSLTISTSQSVTTSDSTPIKPSWVPPAHISRDPSSTSIVAVAGSPVTTPAPPSTISSVNDANLTALVYNTIADVVKLPVKEIIELVFNKPGQLKTGLIDKYDSKIRTETDEWINKLTGLTVHQQKQKLGEKVFKTLRGFNIKGCPKITVDLLDSEDLRSLAHLMNSYPDLLRQKVLYQIENKK